MTRLLALLTAMASWIRSTPRPGRPAGAVEWRGGVPCAPLDEVMAGVERLAVRDAELLRRLAE